LQASTDTGTNTALRIQTPIYVRLRAPKASTCDHAISADPGLFLHGEPGHLHLRWPRAGPDRLNHRQHAAYAQGRALPETAMTTWMHVFAAHTPAGGH